MSAPAGGTATVGRVPVLAYHVIGRGRTPIEISPEQFQAHMGSLHDRGWRALSQDEFLDGLRRKSWAPHRVLLTFDDATVSFAEHALPVLARYSFPAILFAVSGRLGATVNWTGWPAGVDGHLMDADALCEAAAAGIAIGAHSITHRSLSRLAAQEAEQEILGSRARLEDVTGQRVRTFAYPYGDAPAWAVDVAGRHFDAGFGIGLSYATSRSRAALVERIDTYYLREWPALTALERPAARLLLGLRAVARRARRAAGSSYPAR